MRYLPMLGTALVPSVICLGTGSFGSDIAEEAAFDLLDRYVELGGNFLDTAKVYGDWVPGTSSLSEKAIGRWLAARRSRSRVLLATKGGHPALHTMHIPRLEEADIRDDIEQSLRHLQTDYIDLYWLHRDDPDKPVEEIIGYLNRFVCAGKIRYFACSNWRSPRIEAAQRYARREGLAGFAASQTRWSLAVYPPPADKTTVVMDETELAYHKRAGLPAVPYNSQASGFFSGRYAIEDLREASAANAKVWKLCGAENLRRLERVGAIARRLGVGMSGVALAYLTSQPFPVYPIVGCKNAAQLAESCAAGDVTLAPELVAELEGGA